jgi:feruloyl esterase
MKAATVMAKANTRLPDPLRAASVQASSNGLLEIDDFGSNPGRLAMFLHLPAEVRAGAPLIVLLHGCGQSAARFAAEAGWLALADRFGIPLVLPEQSGENNRGRCFNWFQPPQTRRDSGEASSIQQMVAHAVQHFSSDPGRVFIAGLSAGGAMTAALLAAYPDVFAAGAVVAGLPVGAAKSTVEALARMAEAGPARSRQAWAEQVQEAAPPGYAGPWPRISIWHGAADDVVDPTNARLLADQWSALHALDSSAGTSEHPGEQVTVWGPAANPAVELRMLADLPHSWPVGAVDRVARFWGLQQH